MGGLPRVESRGREQPGRAPPGPQGLPRRRALPVGWGAWTVEGSPLQAGPEGGGGSLAREVFKQRGSVN